MALLRYRAGACPVHSHPSSYETLPQPEVSSGPEVQVSEKAAKHGEIHRR